MNLTGGFHSLISSPYNVESLKYGNVLIVRCSVIATTTSLISFVKVEGR
jgi:hypothetical protein